NHNRTFFYNGASFKPADELGRYEILQSIFKELGPDNPLAGQMNGVYTHLKDTQSVISELKASGLTSAELLGILDSNEQVIEAAEKILAPVLAGGIKKSTADILAPLPPQLQKLSSPLSVPSI